MCLELKQRISIILHFSTVTAAGTGIVIREITLNSKRFIIIYLYSQM